MTKKLICGAAAAAILLVAPGAALATPDNGNGHGNGGSSLAAKACAAEKKADKAAFKAVWGKHAMRDCIRAGRNGDETATPAEQAAEFRNAAQECRAERADNPDGFATTYGTNGNLRNAFGKCVSTKVNEPEVEPEPEPTV